MNRYLALARAEVRLLTRNRTTAVTALAIPIAYSVLWLFAQPRSTPKQWATITAQQMGVVLAFGVYITATTTLVARRHGLVLKRLRTTQIGPTGLLLATVTPGLLCAVGQLVVLAVVDGFAGAPAPHNAAALVLAAVLGLALCLAAAVATSVFTAAPERSQITTLPLALVLLAGTTVAVLDHAVLRQALLAVPGTAIGALTRLAFGLDHSAGAVAILPPLAGLLAWVGAFTAFGRARFRWEQRRTG